MDKSALRKIVQESLRPMRMALGLQHITTNIYYEATDGLGVAGTVHDNPISSFSDIVLDAEKIDDESMARNILRHELLHSFTQEYVHLFNMVKKCGVSEEMLNVLDEQFMKAQESAVDRFEYVLDFTLKASPEKLIREGQKIIDGFTSAPKRRKKRR